MEHEVIHFAVSAVVVISFLPDKKLLFLSSCYVGLFESCYVCLPRSVSIVHAVLSFACTTASFSNCKAILVSQLTSGKSSGLFCVGV